MLLLGEKGDGTGQAGWLKISQQLWRMGQSNSPGAVRRWILMVQRRDSGVSSQGDFFSFLSPFPTTNLHCSCNTHLLISHAEHPSSVNVFYSKRCLYFHLHHYKMLSSSSGFSTSPSHLRASAKILGEGLLKGKTTDTLSSKGLGPRNFLLLQPKENGHSSCWCLG